MNEDDIRVKILCDCEARSVAECCCGAWYDSEQPTWIGLTFEEKLQLNDALNLQGRFPIIDAIEALLRSKNI